MTDHRIPWPQLEATFLDHVNLSRASYYSHSHEQQDRAFVSGRFAEGRGIAAFLLNRFGPRELRVLDLGAGNGGVSLAVANLPSARVVAVDHVRNDTLESLIVSSRLPLAHVIASAEQLPFDDGSFEVILCLETIEHIENPAMLGGEAMRVLTRGGICILTTPPRLRFLAARDPHFGIPFLLVLPDRLQQYVATQLTRRVEPEDYDVRHIYWCAGEIAKLFPGRKIFQAVGGHAPSSPLAKKIWSFVQRFSWERLIIEKS